MAEGIAQRRFLTIVSQGSQRWRRRAEFHKYLICGRKCIRGKASLFEKALNKRGVTTEGALVSSKDRDKLASNLRDKGCTIVMVFGLGK